VASISPFVYPQRYRLELTPLRGVNATTKLKGRVVIEFRIDGTPSLSKLSLNARNITATRYKLSLVEKNGVRARRRRRQAENNDINDQRTVADTGISFSELFNLTQNLVSDFFPELECKKR